MDVSVLRWAIASFFGCVAGLALASIPLVAYCVGTGSAPFLDSLVAAIVVALGCVLVVVLSLDLLGARRKRSAGRTRAVSRGRPPRSLHSH